MRSNGFVTGFEKTAGIVSSALAPLKAIGKGAVRAAGGGLNAALIGAGSIMDFAQGDAKLKAAAIGSRV